MNPSIELQKQIKDNAEDVRRFVSDLSNWEEEMKRKESETRSATLKESSVPPIRNATKKRDSGDTYAASSSGESQGTKKRISSSDYAAWEKFDVEKACDEVDDPTTRNKSESDEAKQIKEKRLRDEANVEKEKGNQFVKKEKWDNAIECYSKAIKCYSRDAIFYCNRALCYLKKKDYRAAETDCTSALSLDNNYVKAFHRRGLARKGLNQFEEALEDLKRACEIEPNNTAISRDFNTVQQKIAQLGFDTILETQRIESEADIFIDINPEKKLDPILPAKKHRPSGTSTKESSGRKESTTSMSWPKVEDSIVIEPITIPPHKRSKKPLVRIQIHDSSAGEANVPALFSTESSMNVAPSKTLEKHSDSKKIEELPISHASSVKTVGPIVSSSKPGAPPSTPKLEASLHSLPETLPPVPKNSVQFLAGWRQINESSVMCFQYLKKIQGKDFPKIFQDSLDGNILTQILSVLAVEFVSANEPVFSYLEGLTKVPRFRTLTLFLSQSDKHNMGILLEHTQKLGEAPPHNLVKLKNEYEL